MGNFIYSVDMYIFKDGDFINKKNIIMTEKSQDSLTAFRSIIEKYGLKKQQAPKAVMFALRMLRT